MCPLLTTPAEAALPAAARLPIPSMDAARPRAPAHHWAADAWRAPARCPQARMAAPPSTRRGSMLPRQTTHQTRAIAWSSIQLSLAAADPLAAGRHPSITSTSPPQPPCQLRAACSQQLSLLLHLRPGLGPAPPCQKRSRAPQPRRASTQLPPPSRPPKAAQRGLPGRRPSPQPPAAAAAAAQCLPWRCLPWWV